MYIYINMYVSILQTHISHSIYHQHTRDLHNSIQKLIKVITSQPKIETFHSHAAPLHQTCHTSFPASNCLYTHLLHAISRNVCDENSNSLVIINIMQFCKISVSISDAILAMVILTLTFLITWKGLSLKKKTFWKQKINTGLTDKK